MFRSTPALMDFAAASATDVARWFALYIEAVASQSVTISASLRPHCVRTMLFCTVQESVSAIVTFRTTPPENVQTDYKRKDASYQKKLTGAARVCSLSWLRHWCVSVRDAQRHV